jgi:hypothetical protein
MDDPHPFERSLMGTYKLDAERVRRLLGSSSWRTQGVDFHLIAAVSTWEVKRRGGAGRLSLDDLQAIADEAAEDTFGVHLRAAKDRGR